MYREQRGKRMNVEEKERLIKKDIESVENRVRHAFNQGFEMGVKESCSEIPNTCGDAISRQSAIFLASDLKQDLPDDKRIADMVMAHNEGILEYQTQLSLLPSVSPQQRTGRWIGAEVLDKIREEIHATAEMHEDGDYYLRDEWIDEIIDKYKAESEEKE